MSHARRKLLIFESHPVQYRVPVYQRMQQLAPGTFKVVFGTDCSMRGHFDTGFGREVAWNLPLLEGYEHVILGNQRGPRLEGRGSLHGRGVGELIRNHQPEAILLNGVYFHFDLVTCWQAARMGISLWLRSETQDLAFQRGRLKNLIRRTSYRTLYRRFSRFLFIGELNRRHYLAHGVAAERLRPARYCVNNPFAGRTDQELQQRRAAARERLGIGPNQTVFGFFGKLIFKKGPELLLAAWRMLPTALRQSSRLLYVGSGEMDGALRAQSAGLPVLFTGFINQQELSDYYLAADVVVLPSRQMGETWGLVTNEALHAGCCAIVSSACGCAEEFRSLPGVRVFPAGDVAALAQAMTALAGANRDFHWAKKVMHGYSVEAAAQALLEP